jgi:hypothetical protein
MFTIMFDPHFKSLRGVENYVGCEDYICLAYEFDANVIILLLMLVFEILNCIIQRWRPNMKSFKNISNMSHFNFQS